MKIISVENSIDWFNRMINMDILAQEKMVYINLGPISVSEFSRVQTFEKIDTFRKYTKSLFDFSLQPDIILIDGRFVLASFFEVLYMNNKPVTILFSGYSYYPGARSLIEKYILPDFTDNYWAVFYVNDFIKFHTDEIDHLIMSTLYCLTNN